MDIITEMNRRGTPYADETIRTHVVHHMSADANKRSATGRSDLKRVGRGLYILNDVATDVLSVVKEPTPTAPSVAGDSGHAWPWEGAVQAVFADWLTHQGWSIIGTADTATKARGVDVLARKGSRELGAEVKGWPSTAYADPRRAGELKRTAPTSQASHWFAQALMKAMMLVDSHPGHESLIALPDYPRYRDLAQRTARSRARTTVHVVFVMETGDASSETWTA